MIDKIEAAKREFDHDADAVGDERALESFRVKFLSRNGVISKLFDEMKAAPNEEKPALGKALNQFRKGAEEKFKALEEKLQSDGEEDAVDLSLPGEPAFVGGKHILTQTIDSIKDIFKRMGFSVYEGPELESDYHNFEALNFPPDHPARDEQDTYFVNDKFLLRTHTSPVQIRLMQSTKPPVRAIMPGKVYRNEAIKRAEYEPLLSSRGVARRYRRHLRGSQERADAIRRRILRRELALSVPRQLLPLHRTERRDGYLVLSLRRRGMPRLQAHRLAGNFGMRYGRSERPQKPSATTPTSIRDTRSGWASIGRR